VARLTAAAHPIGLLLIQERIEIKTPIGAKRDQAPVFRNRHTTMKDTHAISLHTVVRDHRAARQTLPCDCPTLTGNSTSARSFMLCAQCAAARQLVAVNWRQLAGRTHWRLGLALARSPMVSASYIAGDAARLGSAVVKRRAAPRRLRAGAGWPAVRFNDVTSIHVVAAGSKRIALCTVWQKLCLRGTIYPPASRTHSRRPLGLELA